MTFEAWIKPDEVVRAEVIAMMGDWGWTVMLTCADDEGVGCCQTSGTHTVTKNAVVFNVDDPSPADPSDCVNMPASTRRRARVVEPHRGGGDERRVCELLHQRNGSGF